MSRADFQVVFGGFVALGGGVKQVNAHAVFAAVFGDAGVLVAAHGAVMHGFFAFRRQQVEVGVFVGAAEQDVDRLSLFDVHRVFAGFAAADMAVNVAVVRGRRDYGSGFGRSLAGGNGEVVWRRFAAFGRRLQHIDLDAVFATLLGGAFVFGAVERAVVQHFVAFGWHQQVVGAGVRCGEFDGKTLSRLEIERVVGGLFAADAAFDVLHVVGVVLGGGRGGFFGDGFFAHGFFRAFGTADGGLAAADGGLREGGFGEGEGREAGEGDEGFVHRDAPCLLTGDGSDCNGVARRRAVNLVRRRQPRCRNLPELRVGEEVAVCGVGLKGGIAGFELCGETMAVRGRDEGVAAAVNQGDLAVGVGEVVGGGEVVFEQEVRHEGDFFLLELVEAFVGGGEQQGVGTVFLRGARRQSAAERVADDGKATIALLLDVCRHAVSVIVELRFAFDAPVAFAVATVVEGVAVVTKRGEAGGDPTPVVQRAGVAVVKEQAALAGRRGGEIEAVQGGAVGRQADFGKRRGEVEAVIWRKRSRVEQQPLLQAIERG